MDGAVRRSLEECDSPQVSGQPWYAQMPPLKLPGFTQGIQIIEDNLTFGSFIDSFINSFRDEFSRLPILSFPLLSQSIPTRSGTEGVCTLRPCLTARCLCSQNRHSSEI